jgi:hypothetical protein
MAERSGRWESTDARRRAPDLASVGARSAGRIVLQPEGGASALVAAVSAGSEGASEATMMLRVLATVEGGGETAAAGSVAERIALGASGGSEAASSAMGATRGALSAASGSDASSIAGVAERLVTVVESVAEAGSAVTLAELVSATTASGGETGSDSAFAVALASGATAGLMVASGSEGASASTMDAVNPPVVLSIGSTTESGSDAREGQPVLPTMPLPAIARYAVVMPPAPAVSLAVASGTESGSAGELAVRLRLAVRVAAVSESGGACALESTPPASVSWPRPVVRLAVGSASATHSATDLAQRPRITATVASAGEGASEAELDASIPSRPWSLAGETVDDATLLAAYDLLMELA